MKKAFLFNGLALLGLSAFAQVPAVLLEACNAMEPASKRIECLRAANNLSSTSNRNYSGAQSGASALAPQAPTRVNRADPSNNLSSSTCHVGPRGGTYTITASGRKNYSGC